MDRRRFLKKAGVGSVALASIPALADVAWAHDDRDGRTNFYFVALSGTENNLFGPDTIAMSGSGSFGHSGVRGGGEFNHFDGTKFGNPDNLRRFGSWRATRFTSFLEVGTWGIAVSGILTIEVKLIPCVGPAIRGATLEIVCNLAPASIFTGKTEGFTLTLPGPVTFSPFSPSNVGLTLFTRRCPSGDDGD